MHSRMKVRGTAVTLTVLIGLFGAIYLLLAGISTFGILLGFLLSLTWFVPLWLLSVRALVVPEEALRVMQMLAGFSIGLSFSLIFFYGFLEITGDGFFTFVLVVAFVSTVVIGIWSWNFPKVGSQMLFVSSAILFLTVNIVAEINTDSEVNFSSAAATPGLLCAYLFWLSRPRFLTRST
jgi:hypothetical protein